MLNIGVTIQLERIEVLCHYRVLVAMLDLRLGLDFEFPQLFAKSCDSLFEFIDVKLDGRNLLTQP